MTLSTIVAAVHGGIVSGPLTVVLVIAALGYVMWKRMQGEAVKDKRRLLVLPAVFVVLGVVNVAGSHAPRLGSASVAFLVVGR